ncbi:Autophagy-related 12 [Carabus blaptoides fortunei]
MTEQNADDSNLQDTESTGEREHNSNNTLSLDTTEKKDDKQKVDILLKPTGNAPIMKKKKWAVDADKQIGWIMEFIKKYLKLESEEKLFLYVNQTFAPSPDQTVRNLYNCYSTEEKCCLNSHIC